jgi:hypothetical protein
MGEDPNMLTIIVLLKFDASRLTIDFALACKVCDCDPSWDSDYKGHRHATLLGIVPTSVLCFCVPAST